MAGLRDQLAASRSHDSREGVGGARATPLRTLSTNGPTKTCPCGSTAISLPDKSTQVSAHREAAPAHQSPRGRPTPRASAPC